MSQEIECSNCGAHIEDESHGIDGRQPCGVCGSNSRNYFISINEKAGAKDGYKIKAKLLGRKKPYIEDSSKSSHSYSLNKAVHRRLVIERDNDLYFEKVTEYETGKIIHKCDDPLSRHQGHGDAKHKKRS